MNTVLGEILANRVLLSLVSDVFQAQFFGELADKRQEGCHYILYSICTHCTRMIIGIKNQCRKFLWTKCYFNRG